MKFRIWPKPKQSQTKQTKIASLIPKGSQMSIQMKVGIEYKNPILLVLQIFLTIILTIASFMNTYTVVWKALQY